MAFNRKNRAPAERELLLHLDYYVESVMVHDCHRRDHALWLLHTAERDQLWLLLMWTSAGQTGAEETQDA